VQNITRGPTETGALDERASAHGRAWAQSVRADLQNEGRRAAGGWPGTISEARVHAERALSSRGVAPQERERLARLIYHTARDAWLATRDALDED